MEPRHQAIAAGLALTLAIGTVGTPTITYASTDTGTERADSLEGAAASGSSTGDGTSTGDDAAEEELPAPAEYDRADDYVEDPSAEGMPTIMTLSLNSLLSGRSARVSITPQSLSSEMRYFAENESGSNYDQGFSYGDGYNAMGFYQFDRRYSLLDFIEACYSYDSSKYSMFAAVIERGDELQNGATYDSSTKQLTEIGQLAEDAWHAAYAADPAEFSALQDNFAYQEYYLTVERILRNNFGVDISGRADCVKGLAWGLCNLFGSGGCQRFFKLANLSDDMTDREFVNALCDAVVENVDGYTYGASYRARYERERATCLSYISEDEAAAEQPGSGSDTETGSDDGTAPGDDAVTGGDATGDDTANDDATGGDTAGGDAVGGDAAGGDAAGGTDGDAGATEPGDGSASAGGPSSDGGAAGDTGTTDPAGDSASDDGSSDGDAANGDVSDGASGDTSDGAADDPAGDSTGDPGSSDGSGTSSGGDEADGSDSSDQGGSTQDGAAGTTGSPSDGAAGDDGQKTDDGNSSGGSSDTGSGSQDGDGSGAKREANGSKGGDAAEPERLPATADAASIALAVSAGLSALGAGAVVAGKRSGGVKDPFVDGFRE
ncbi:VgrG-related protein [Candidatus Collinsella stercoripullorum]|uniref:VgrG-related protein n=1 Tax=Candidatus Collinsella stercoripullorum TaxID=2838522 RepID=UPI0022DF284D|nr:hypothetical protein [Candidatus Collinsella stercoripullorum]